MLKLFIVMVPMLVGGALASAARSETVVAVPTTGVVAATELGVRAAAPIQARSFASHGQSSSSRLPEPATWAMMICGMGVVGAMSRRRRAQGLAIAA
jgi:hypothetical protein